MGLAGPASILRQPSQLPLGRLSWHLPCGGAAGSGTATQIPTIAITRASLLGMFEMNNVLAVERSCVVDVIAVTRMLA